MENLKTEQRLFLLFDWFEKELVFWSLRFIFLQGSVANSKHKEDLAMMMGRWFMLGHMGVSISSRSDTH